MNESVILRSRVLEHFKGISKLHYNKALKDGEVQQKLFALTKRVMPLIQYDTESLKALINLTDAIKDVCLIEVQASKRNADFCRELES
jgi:hypothetical protein